MTQTRFRVDTFLFAVVAATAWQFGYFLNSMLLPLSGLPAPALPASATERPFSADWAILGGIGLLLFVVSLVLMVKSSGGSGRGNFVRFFLLLWVATTGNVVIELHVFSRVFVNGGTAYHLLSGVLPCALLAATLAVLGMWESERRQHAELATAAPVPLSARYWIARFSLGVLAFLVIYLAMGFVVSPIVVPFYRADSTFVLPTMGTLLVIACIRASLYVVTLLPLIVFWRESPRRLAVTLGFAFAMVSGCYALMISPGVFPFAVQAAHFFEIAVDAFLFVAALCWIYKDGVGCMAHSTGRRSLAGTSAAANHADTESRLKGAAI